MATTNDQQGSESPSVDPDTLGTASFVTIRIAPTLEAMIAAAGIIEQAQRRTVPFHLRTERRPTYGSDAGLTVAVGYPDEAAPSADVTVRGSEGTIGGTPSVFQAPSAPYLTRVQKLATASASAELPPIDADTGPTVGIAPAELKDGLAFSTLLHGPWSGSHEAVESTLAGIDTNDAKDVASLVTLDGLETAVSDRAATMAIPRFLTAKPVTAGPWQTDVGALDVLDVLSVVAPGVALGTLLGEEHAAETGLDRWMETSREIHGVLATVRSTGDDEQETPAVRISEKKAGVAAIESSTAPARPTARLLRDFALPQADTVVVAGPEEVTVATADLSAECLATMIEPESDDWLVHGDDRVSTTGDPAAIATRIREDRE